MANYDIIGDIAILKPEGFSKAKSAKIARNLLKQPNVRTVVGKIERFKGRLRTIKTKHLLGEKNLEAEYKENGCIFKLNIESCYFSPRLANERLEIARKIRKKDRVLVMFSGVAPYPIVIAKKTGAKITAIELGRQCNKYAKENLRLNNLENKIRLIQGDAKKVIGRKIKEKFEVIVMPRPNLKETFLKQALSASKKGAHIFYYGFGREGDIRKEIEKLKKEAGKCRRKIRILKIKKAGDIAPYKYRWRIEIKAL